MSIYEFALKNTQKLLLEYKEAYRNKKNQLGLAEQKISELTAQLSEARTLYFELLQTMREQYRSASVNTNKREIARDESNQEQKPNSTLLEELLEEYGGDVLSL